MGFLWFDLIILFVHLFVYEFCGWMWWTEMAKSGGVSFGYLAKLDLEELLRFCLLLQFQNHTPKILTHQTKTLIFIWVLLNPFFIFFLPSSSHWVQIALQLQFFFFFYKTQHNNINQNWVAEEQKWVSFSLFAGKCKRTKMGFSSFLGL
jgi:hypothetical protein